MAPGSHWVPRISWSELPFVMQYTLTSNNIHIISSFLVKKKDFERELTAIRELHPDCGVWNRTIDSLKREWTVHNALHRLGIARKRTADTDLNWPQPWLTRALYTILGALLWPFVE